MPRASIPTVLAAALTYSACGAGAGGDGARVSAAIAVSGLQASAIASVQLTVLANGQRFNCDQLRSTCLSASPQVDLSKDAVPLRGADGKDHRALRFDLSGDRLLASGDSATLTLPPGTNYLVVAEVLAASGPPWLLASGCEVRDVVTSGENPALNIVASALTSSPTCDPHID